MMLLPRAEFWRLWARAAIVAALALAFLIWHPVARAETLRASWYGAESGASSASGAPFRPMGLTAAHPAWPFGTRFRACLATCAEGTVTDRGPARWTGRGIDLSRGLARAIGLERRGVAAVDITILSWGQAGHQTRGAHHARGPAARRRSVF